MVMFCLVLATAAFVLAGAPQPCRCDRTPNNGSDAALRATLSADSAFDGNVWRRIRERVLSGDGHNLISAAKLSHDVPSTFAWNRPGVNPSELILLESLINRYRKYMVESVVRFDDACSLLFGGEAAEDDRDENGEPSQVALESRTETSHSRDGSNGLVDGTIGSSLKGANDGGGALNQFQRDGPVAETMQLRRPNMNDLCARSAKQYYQCLLDRLNDQQLIGMVQDYLKSYCIRRDSFDRSTAALQKRDTPRYVSKQKFHSWGGKRNTAQVFYPWGGKRTVPRPHKQPKVVIRNPFHSWGGKRSGIAID
uniref:Leucokinin n=1 Tax=Anopheles culicifacies TaxID=139723 RepID=A0A182M1G9_9DIPT